MSQIFNNLEKFKNQNEIEKKDSQETASFKYSIINKNTDEPELCVKIEDYDLESIKSLACLIASLSNENFIFQALMYIEKGFSDKNKIDEFIQLIEEIDKYKNKINKSIDRVCVLPSELMGS